MRILFISNYPSPYRVDFFNLFGQYVELTVAFTERVEAQKHRSAKWFNKDYSGFNAVFLEDQFRIGRYSFFKDILPLLRSHYDHIILGGYSSGTQMAAIEYMKIHKIPFTIEADGGLISNDSKFRYLVKKHFIGSANYWLSSGKSTTNYFIYYGANEDNIYMYPFASQRKKDLVQAELTKDEEHTIFLEGEEYPSKCYRRKKLDISEKRMVLFVGQMIYRKGIDVLLKAAAKLPRDVAVVIVGGEPTEEYLKMKQILNLDHVYFVGFKEKEELSEYYRAADLFVMPTREDIWGLVINEAMSYSLPIVSTDRCVAALELVENNINGIIVPVGDPNSLANGILQLLNSDLIELGKQSRSRIQKYNIENMVNAHIEFLDRIKNKESTM